MGKIDAETSPELDLHLIVDNYSTHKHPKVLNWRFRDITQNRIRNGVFKSVAQLIQAIHDYIAHHTANPKWFVWTKTPKISSKSRPGLVVP